MVADSCAQRRSTLQTKNAGSQDITILAVNNVNIRPADNNVDMVRYSSEIAPNYPLTP